MKFLEFGNMKNVDIINLTGEEVVVIDKNENQLIIPIEGKIDNFLTDKSDIINDTFPFYDMEINLKSLPEVKENTLYIVPLFIATYVKRPDFLISTQISYKTDYERRIYIKPLIRLSFNES